ncbi:UNVERIFIED_CONTAM: hypothetical protein Sradi_1525200 [Sesamum radiatum]|uniref:Endonuclease/exonuclease/phosphatase n=1 Tax=Sesamum radiatum TaxID=300843 RepID=A0AAW2UA53_SESRA
MYTWCNWREGPHIVSGRLDRACGNSRWVSCFPISVVSTLPTSYSDHSILIVQWELTARSLRGRRNRRFRFEASWLQSEDCNRVVEEASSSPGSLDVECNLFRKIQECRVGLLCWNREHFLTSKQNIKRLEEHFAGLEARPIGSDEQREMDCIRQQLEDINIRERLKWQQRSKAYWLRDGDGNTKFFHSYASVRR